MWEGHDTIVKPSGLKPDDPGQIPPTKELARRDYLRSLMADLPTPEELVWHLPDDVTAALLSARRSRQAENCGQMRQYPPEGFVWGLCDRDGFLTAYGMKVRHFLMEEMQ